MFFKKKKKKKLREKVKWVLCLGFEKTVEKGRSKSGTFQVLLCARIHKSTILSHNFIFKIRSCFFFSIIFLPFPLIQTWS